MKRSRGWVIARTLLLLLLLAAVCIGSMELLFCRIADPPLFFEITAPVRTVYLDARSETLDFWGRMNAVRDDLRAENTAHAQALRLAREEEARRLAEEEAARAAEEAQDASLAALQTDSVAADPADTELVTEAGQEYLTGGNLRLPYYNQGDEAWRDKLFGRDPVGRFGCGPVVLSMLVSAMTGEPVDPAEMAAWAGNAGYAAPKSGSYLSIVQGTAEHYGLACEPFPIDDADALLSQLSAGGAMVALMGPGHFTAGGHFILLHGVTLTGEVLVADPNSRERSLSVWDAQLILDELSQSRHNGAPLWYFPPPDVS